MLSLRNSGGRARAEVYNQAALRGARRHAFILDDLLINAHTAELAVIRGGNQIKLKVRDLAAVCLKPLPKVAHERAAESVSVEGRSAATAYLGAEIEPAEACLRGGVGVVFDIKRLFAAALAREDAAESFLDARAGPRAHGQYHDAFVALREEFFHSIGLIGLQKVALVEHDHLRFLELL